MTGPWIVVANWERFQHYGNRDPVWIKVYVELNSRDEFLSLTGAERGLLLTIWVEYARARGQLSVSTVASLMGAGWKHAQLKSLVQAGFIQLRASAPPRYARSREVEVEKEKKDLKAPPLKPETRKPAATPAYKSNVQAADGYAAIVRMIHNGIIEDELYLDAEIRGYGLDEKLAAELHEMLK